MRPDSIFVRKFVDMTSVELAFLLRLTEDIPPAPDRNLIKAELTDELTRRYASVAEALEVWSQDISDPRTSTDVVLAALPEDVREAVNG